MGKCAVEILCIDMRSFYIRNHALLCDIHICICVYVRRGACFNSFYCKNIYSVKHKGPSFPLFQNFINRNLISQFGNIKGD